MKRSLDPAEIAKYLADESRMTGGFASEVAWPASPEEAAELLRESAASGTPVTVSGAGTGITGGRVPQGGLVLALDRMNRILEIGPDRARVQAGTLLSEVFDAAGAAGLWYPPDPTEWGCSIGGTVATNASGARTFRCGPTRRWVEGLRVALADGTLLDLPRGAVRAAGGRFEIPRPGRTPLVVPAPDWSLPRTSKHAAGYFSAPEMDLVDLFVGSEGTLGAVLEAELRLIPAPEEFLAGIFFFDSEEGALAFVDAARAPRAAVAALSLEFFDAQALGLLREKGIALPGPAQAAIFWEEALGGETRPAADAALDAWLALGAAAGARDDSWVAEGPRDHGQFRDFRHEVPASINEKLARRGVAKVSTDTAVPRGQVRALLRRTREELARESLEHAIFGHVGDDHLHVNILARDPGEYAAARAAYGRLVAIAVEMGGTTSAEHGLGKLKAGDLARLYPPAVLDRMRAIRSALDPAGILGRGTLL
ncbi:MAG: FAD-binding oxidoreductase [Acidobacteria bacterium]|jgi:D-lactate dehydrogenase (cytochrome)|nr:FAD-binding oxidoreductase [Acidobacteriota bacterium]